MNKYIPPKIRIFTVPVLIFAIIGVLSLILGNFGMAMINKQKAELGKLKKVEDTFKAKQSVLTEAQGSILPKTEASVYAVPEKSPALTMSAQIKKLAEAKSVAIEDFKVASKPGGSSGVFFSDASFNASGTLTAVLDFAKGLYTVAPILSIDKMDLSNSGSEAKSSMVVKAYFAPFPKTLPDTSQPIRALSSDDQAILDKLSSLTPPAFVSITPSKQEARSDPFSF